MNSAELLAAPDTVDVHLNVWLVLKFSMATENAPFANQTLAPITSPGLTVRPEIECEA